MQLLSSLRLHRFKNSIFSCRSFMATVSETDTRDLEHNLRLVESRIRRCEHEIGLRENSIRLVAVSKTKPASDIQELYDAGHRHFGENYVQELCSKAKELPSDICWHFIGHLQSQKSKMIVSEVPNLYALETLDSVKLANKLQNALTSADRPLLKVFIQVHTSNEDTKSGVSPEDLEELLLHVQQSCDRLRIAGLMTIGAPGDMSCFDKLVECRKIAARVLNMDENELELSMGMSGDFEEAIRRGSTSVRVGSVLFGPRKYASPPAVDAHGTNATSSIS